MFTAIDSESTFVASACDTFVASACDTFVASACATFVASACECGVAFGITPYAIFSILFAGGNPSAVPVRIWRGGNEFRAFFKIILGGGITLGYALEKFLGFCKVCTVEFL